jgi:hypothetical protein
VLLCIAKELEFDLTLMCTTKEGYETRVRTTAEAARLLCRADVWDPKSDPGGLEDAREIVESLKGVCARRKETR